MRMQRTSHVFARLSWCALLTACCALLLLQPPALPASPAPAMSPPRLAVAIGRQSGSDAASGSPGSGRRMDFRASLTDPAAAGDCSTPTAASPRHSGLLTARLTQLLDSGYNSLLLPLQAPAAPAASGSGSPRRGGGSSAISPTRSGPFSQAAAQGGELHVVMSRLGPSALSTWGCPGASV
jgi:hypothetical protein